MWSRFGWVTSPMRPAVSQAIASFSFTGAALMRRPASGSLQRWPYDPMAAFFGKNGAPTFLRGDGRLDCQPAYRVWVCGGFGRWASEGLVNFAGWFLLLVSYLLLVLRYVRPPVLRRRAVGAAEAAVPAMARAPTTVASPPSKP
jgi:hypothetical protein